MSNFKAATYWHKRGLNVLPRKSATLKHPPVQWKGFQTRRITSDELWSWHSMFEVGGVGFVTGAISKTIVIETDGPIGDALIAAFEDRYGSLPVTLTIASGRGIHRHFQHPGHRVPTRVNREIQIDVKGDAGFCVLPPSIHKDGGQYRVIVDAEPAMVPAGLLEYIERASAIAKGKTPRAKRTTHLTDLARPPAPEPDTPRRRARLGEMLKHISADCGYDRYRAVVWAILGTNWHDAQAIAKTWCIAAPHRFEQLSFNELIRSFDFNRADRPTLGTIHHLAVEGGWHE